MAIPNLKDIFKLKKEDSNGHTTPTVVNEESFGVSKETIEESGFNSGHANRGSTIGLSICLNRIYSDHKQKVKDDVGKQEELKKPYRAKLHDLMGENEVYINRLKKIKEEEIPLLEDKKHALERQIDDIKTNPSKISGDKTGKASYIIGLIILLFLTVYLFIFYSSASYSAFFKEFKPSEIAVANSIFDAQAIAKSWVDGWQEFTLIITIPAVFLGLGFLIHKGQAKKGWQKIGFIGSLVLVTLVFDIIIGYEICHKLYVLGQQNSFEIKEDYSVGLAVKDINFWLIIFAGFVVYIIWGLVFSFTMDAHEKLDMVKIAIRNKESEMKMHDDKIDGLRIEINKIEMQEGINKSEITKLKDIIENTTIIPKEFEQYLFQFMQGWLHWMSANLHNEEKQSACKEVLNDFISKNIIPEVA